jgi:hypothetical protein
MPNLHSYDTSTQAMTEVALGLSMAFFALLILALLSFQMPTKKALQPAPKTSLTDSERVNINQDPLASDTQAKPRQFVFYFKGGFIGQDLKPSAIREYSVDQPLVLVVEKNLTFSEVVALRSKINHPNLSITQLSDEWQAQLEQIK